MKFTIGTVSGYLEFTEDINLIKSSLLYADEIEMIGMLEYAVFKYLPNRVNDAKSLEELMTNWVPLLESVEVPGRTEILTQIRDLQDQFTVINPILKKKKKRTRKKKQIRADGAGRTLRRNRPRTSGSFRVSACGTAPIWAG